MNAFVPVERDVRDYQLFREAFLAQPPEFFLTHYGVLPNGMEKLFLVERLLQSMSAQQVFANDVYMVRMRNQSPFIQLNITRHDGGPCANWRDFQRIKNELVGPECEAVELFPAESRLVDTSNEYHLWVVPDRNYRFPLGFQHRLVMEDPLVFYKNDQRVQVTADNSASAPPAKVDS
jgi:hypothetical protein